MKKAWDSKGVQAWRSCPLKKKKRPLGTSLQWRRGTLRKNKREALEYLTDMRRIALRERLDLGRKKVVEEDCCNVSWKWWIGHVTCWQDSWHFNFK